MTHVYATRGVVRGLETIGAWVLGLLWLLPLLYAVWTAFHPAEFSTRFALSEQYDGSRPARAPHCLLGTGIGSFGLKRAAGWNSATSGAVNTALAGSIPKARQSTDSRTWTSPAAQLPSETGSLIPPHIRGGQNILVIRLHRAA